MGLYQDKKKMFDKNGLPIDRSAELLPVTKQVQETIQEKKTAEKKTTAKKTANAKKTTNTKKTTAKNSRKSFEKLEAPAKQDQLESTRPRFESKFRKNWLEQKADPLGVSENGGRIQFSSTFSGKNRSPVMPSTISETKEKADRPVFVPSAGLETQAPKASGIHADYNPFGAYRVTSAVGPRNTGIPGASRNHKGTDYAMPVGTQIPSPVSGEVIETGYNSARGYYVRVRDGQGNIHTVQHLSKILTQKGEKVNASDVIAASGNSGVGSGAHLHYEITGPAGEVYSAENFFGQSDKQKLPIYQGTGSNTEPKYKTVKRFESTISPRGAAPQKTEPIFGNENFKRFESKVLDNARMQYPLITPKVQARKGKTALERLEERYGIDSERFGTKEFLNWAQNNNIEVLMEDGDYQLYNNTGGFSRYISPNATDQLGKDANTLKALARNNERRRISETGGETGLERAQYAAGMAVGNWMDTVTMGAFDKTMGNIDRAQYKKTGLPMDHYVSIENMQSGITDHNTAAKVAGAAGDIVGFFTAFKEFGGMASKGLSVFPKFSSLAPKMQQAINMAVTGGTISGIESAVSKEWSKEAWEEKERAQKRMYAEMGRGYTMQPYSLAGNILGTVQDTVYGALSGYLGSRVSQAVGGKVTELLGKSGLSARAIAVMSQASGAMGFAVTASMVNEGRRMEEIAAYNAKNGTDIQYTPDVGQMAQNIVVAAVLATLDGAIRTRGYGTVPAGGASAEKFKYFSDADLKSTAALKTKYRALAKQYHPDVAGENNIFKEITAEYARAQASVYSNVSAGIKKDAAKGTVRTDTQNVKNAVAIVNEEAVMADAGGQPGIATGAAASMAQTGKGTEEYRQYSIRNVNGSPVVVIEEDIFSGHDGEKPHKVIRDYLRRHIGEYATIIESGQKVYLGKDLPGEYTQSKYTKQLGNGLKKVKGQATQNLDEMIEIATDRSWIKNNKDKHALDAKYGWYKYLTRFQVGADVYSADILIRNADDGKKYLYDVINIKRDTAQRGDYTPHLRTVGYDRTDVSGTGIPNINISQNGGDVNKYSIKNGEENVRPAFTYERSMKLLQDFSEKTGIQVILDRSLGPTEEGYYDPKTGELHINPNQAGRMNTLIKHEFTHVLERSPYYTELVDYVQMNLPEEWEAAKSLVRGIYETENQRRTASGAPAVELTETRLSSEAMAKLAEQFQTDEFIRDTCRKDPSIAQRFIQIIRDLIARIKEIFGKGYAKPWETAQRKWEKAFSDVVKNGVEPHSKVQDSGRYAILENPKGKYVKADRQVITGDNPAQWAKSVEQYINSKIRNGQDIVLTASDGDLLTITRDTAGKAKFRNDVLRGDGTKTKMSDQEYRAKLDAESHIDELAQASTRGNKTVPDYKNHKFAKDGFNYRTAYFEDFDGTYYRITLSVGKNGEINTVYNVGRMDKKTNPLKPAQRPNGGETADGGLANHSVSQNVDTVNGKTKEAQFPRGSMAKRNDSAIGTSAPYDTTISQKESSVNNYDMSTKKKYSFGGINAKTADMAQLAKAREMEEQGEAREAIFRETGWFRGADGRWRFEIDDSGARILPEKAREGQVLGDVLEHPALYEAYPELSGYPITAKAGTGYSGRIQMDTEGNTTKAIGINKSNLSGPPEIQDQIARLKATPQWQAIQERRRETADRDAVTAMYEDFFANDPVGQALFPLLKAQQEEQGYYGEDAKDIILHEIQHGIQGIEGFSKGASPAAWEKVLSMREQEVALKEAMQRSLPHDIGLGRIISQIKAGKLPAAALEERFQSYLERYIKKHPEQKPLVDYATKGTEQSKAILARLRGLFAQYGGSAEDLYRQTAGEQEAREVQARMNMTEAQRRESFPNVPENPAFIEEFLGFDKIPGVDMGGLDIASTGENIGKSNSGKTLTEQIDRWDTEGRNRDVFFDLGKPSTALISAGIDGNNIHMDASKVLRILSEHPEMTLDIIKQLDNVIGDPIIVLKSKNQNAGNSFVIYGDVAGENGRPVMVAIRTGLKGGVNAIEDVSKITSAYTRRNTQSLLNSSEVRWINPDEKRTANWMYSFGLQLPSATSISDSLIDNSIPYSNTVVNSQDMQDGENYAQDLKQIQQDPGRPVFRAREPKPEPTAERPVFRARQPEAKEESRPVFRSKIMGDTDRKKALDDLSRQYGEIEPGEKPAREVHIPKKISDRKPVSQFARTMMEAGVTPDWAVSEFEQQVLDGTMAHEIITDKQAEKKAEEQIQERGYKEALRDWETVINRGSLKKDDLAFGMTLYNQAITNKDTQTAMRLAAELAAEATRTGQNLQALRMLKNMTPDGQLYALERTVRSINQDIVDRFKKSYPEVKIDPALAESFLKAEAEEAREAALDKIYQNIADQIPAAFTEKLNSWRYMAMLINPRTHFRNILGNVAMMPAVRMKNSIGALIEKAVLPKEERTKALKSSRAAKDFAAKDINNVIDELMGGGSKYVARGKINDKRQIFQSKFLETARKGSSNILEKEDELFLRHHYKNSLAQAITARGYTTEFLTNGTKEANQALAELRSYAIEEAKQATYRDKNIIAEKISQAQRRLENSKNPALQAVGIGVEGTMPFKSVPLNIAKQGLAYSPLGLGKGIYDMAVNVRTGKKTGAEAINTLAKGMTGTAAMLLGLFLAHMGILVAGGDEDEKKNRFDDMVGRQAYALKLWDWSYTLDWAAPASLPLFVGAEIYKAAQDQDLSLGEAADAILRIGDPMMELTVLSGVNDALEAARYSDQKSAYAVIERVMSNYLTQLVPAVGGQVSRVADGTRRNYYYTDKNNPLPAFAQSIINQTAAKIPGASLLYPPSVDAWGRERSYGKLGERLLENFVSPGYYSEEKLTEVDKEIETLYDKTGESKVFPVKQAKKITENGVEYDLTNKEYTELSKIRGEKSFELVQELIGTEKYKKMSDADKVEEIAKAYTEARKYAKSQFFDKMIAERKERGMTVGEPTPIEVTVDGTKYALSSEVRNEYEKALKEKKQKNLENLESGKTMGELWGTDSVEITRQYLKSEIKNPEMVEYAIRQYLKAERNKKKNKKSQEELQKEIDAFKNDKKKLPITYNISDYSYSELDDYEKERMREKADDSAVNAIKRQFHDRILEEGDVVD